MIPFILPASSATTNGARRDVDPTSHPLASPKSGVPHIEWHPQPQPSPSLSAFHDQSASNDIGSRSFVEFHHNQLDPPEELNLGMGTTLGPSQEVSQVRDRGEYSVNSRVGMAMADHAANMPTVLHWPLHPHPLHYAGSSSGDSVRIMTCRNCRSEHYNSAVYSCVERGCNFHVCLACALEQLSAVSEAKAAAQQTRDTNATAAGRKKATTRKGSKEAEDKAEALMKAEDRQRWDARHGVGEGELVLHKVEPGVTAIDVGQVQPVTYTRDRLKREYESTRNWITAVEYDSSRLGLRLSTPCTIHGEHPLVYHAISPPPLVWTPSRKPSGVGAPVKPAPAMTDRYFCDAVLSPYCMSHDLNKSLRPVYACRQCNYRVCMPCYRWYLLDHFSRLRSSLSYEAADERIVHLMKEYKRTRTEDSRALAYSDVMSRKEAMWGDRIRRGYWTAAVSTFIAVVLLNAILTMADRGVAYQLLNVVLILIGSVAASLGASFLTTYALHAHAQCIAHYKTVDALYLDPALSFFFHTPRTSPIPIAAVTPKQRDRLSDVYHHHGQVIGYQHAVLRVTWLAIAFLLCGTGLLVSGVTVLFIDVVCSLQIYGGVEAWCEIRSGVPVAVILMAVLMWGTWLEVIRRSWYGVKRWMDEVKMYRKEEKQRTKWQRRE